MSLGHPTLDTEAKAVGIDLSQWPVMVIDSSSTSSDVAMEAQMAFLRRLYAQRKGVYANVIDARRAAPPSPRQRAMLGAFREEVRDHVRQHCRGGAFVFDSMLMRGVMTALFWLRPPDAPTEVFATLEEALAWARTQVFAAEKMAG